MNGQYEYKMEINKLIRQVMEGSKPSELEGVLYYQDQIVEVVKLVAAKERERYMQLFLDPENQPTQFGTATQEYREQEIKDEREACAKVCEDSVEYAGDTLAEAIRARA
jgi:hypothetical protein